MLMRRDELSGFGDLGKFKLKKLVKKLSPVHHITRAKQVVATVKKYSKPQALIKLAKGKATLIKKLHDPREHLKFAKSRHAAHMKAYKSSPALQNVFKAAVVAVAGWFTAGAAVGPLMGAWSADRKRREGLALNAQEEAEAAANEQLLREEIMAGGYSAEQAEQVIAALRAGSDPAAALQALGPPRFQPPAAVVEGSPIRPAMPPRMPPIKPGGFIPDYGKPPMSGDSYSVPSVPSSQGADPKQAKQEAAREQFFRWFEVWKPQEAEALRDQEPELFAPLSADAGLSGFDDDSGDWNLGDVGLGDWGEMFSGWATSFANIAPKILSTVADAKMLQIQLQRARNSLPPLPTAKAAQVAAASPQRGTGMAVSIPLVIGGVLALGLGVVILAPGLFRPRHHSRYVGRR